MAHAGDQLRAIGLDLHAPAAAITLLAAPELMIDCIEGNGHTRGQSGQDGDQTFSVRFTCCLKSKHCKRKFYRIGWSAGGQALQSDRRSRERLKNAERARIRLLF